MIELTEFNPVTNEEFLYICSRQFSNFDLKTIKLNHGEIKPLHSS